MVAQQNLLVDIPYVLVMTSCWPEHLNSLALSSTEALKLKISLPSEGHPMTMSIPVVQVRILN